MSKQTKKTVIIATCCAVLMFGFSFALSPLYRKVCEVTGLNGGINVAEIKETDSTGVLNTQRNIIVQFVTSNNADLAWEFHPDKNTLTVHPGELSKMNFYAKNLTHHTMTVQAIPSFSPAVSAQYFHKLECFCFTRQTLQAGETKEMPVVFRIDKTLPPDINLITLAYTLFDVTKLRKSG
ncbi:MAG: cytochrome c oxidase assembly protein [Gammaproteobacteria bacterium]